TFGVATGPPHGRSCTATGGVVSALEPELPTPPTHPPLKGLIQTDTPINPGNSGGPLVDAQGRVIGITTAILPYAQGLGFAVPTATVIGAIARLKEQRDAQPAPRFGVSGIAAPVDSDAAKRHGLTQTQGVLLIEVRPGSAAERASLKPMDMLLTLDGTTLTSVEALRKGLESVVSGTTVEIAFLRAGTLRRTHAVLAAAAA